MSKQKLMANAKLKICMFGYVGLSLAVLLAQHNKVYAVDIVTEKVELINKLAACGYKFHYSFEDTFKDWLNDCDGQGLF